MYVYIYTSPNVYTFLKMVFKEEGAVTYCVGAAGFCAVIWRGRLPNSQGLVSSAGCCELLEPRTEFLIHLIPPDLAH